MPSRFDECFGTKSVQRVPNLMPGGDFLHPTSIAEQYNTGWMKTERPVGGEPPDQCCYPFGGNAGMDTDHDADDATRPPIAAAYPAERSSA
jgi:hypothetical protein